MLFFKKKAADSAATEQKRFEDLSLDERVNLINDFQTRMHTGDVTRSAAQIVVRGVLIGVAAAGTAYVVYRICEDHFGGDDTTADIPDVDPEVLNEIEPVDLADIR